VNWFSYHLCSGSISKLSQKCSLYNTLNSILRNTKAVNDVYKAKVLDSWALEQMVQSLAKFCNFKAYRGIKSTIVKAKEAFNKKKTHHQQIGLKFKKKK
jgi:hypothetical protein